MKKCQGFFPWCAGCLLVLDFWCRCFLVRRSQLENPEHLLQLGKNCNNVWRFCCSSPVVFESLVQPWGECLAFWDPALFASVRKKREGFLAVWKGFLAVWSQTCFDFQPVELAWNYQLHSLCTKAVLGSRDPCYVNHLETTRLLEVGCRDVRQRRKVTQFPRPKGIFPKGFEFVFYHESAQQQLQEKTPHRNICSLLFVYIFLGYLASSASKNWHPISDLRVKAAMVNLIQKIPKVRFRLLEVSAGLVDQHGHAEVCSTSQCVTWPSKDHIFVRMLEVVPSTFISNWNTVCWSYGIVVVVVVVAALVLLLLT